MPPTDPLVSVEQVTRRFPLDHSAVTALDHVNLRIDAGEFLAISGPSGSGKSTLLEPDRLHRQAHQRPHPDRRRRHLEAQLLANLRAAPRKDRLRLSDLQPHPRLHRRENVEYPLLIQGVSASERRKRVAEALENVGLSARAQQRPDLLSGGERQRVAVARAIVHRPALVLADEPTANLDTHNATQLIDLMRDLNRSLGLTFIFSTHDQRLLEHTPRIVRLTDGRIISDTPP